MGKKNDKTEEPKLTSNEGNVNSDILHSTYLAKKKLRKSSMSLGVKQSNKYTLLVSLPPSINLTIFNEVDSCVILDKSPNVAKPELQPV